MSLSLRTLVFLAGLGQLVLAAASLAIPQVMRWREGTAGLSPLLRQTFWTYAAYIWGFNLSFGLLSTLAPSWLLDGSPLAVAVSAFIAVYWGARLIVQFAYFDRADLPTGRRFRLAEAGLVALFLYLALVYGTVAVTGLSARRG